MSYTPEQRSALDSVVKATRRLEELEELQAQAYQPIINLDRAMDSAVADVCMDQFPPYSVLENRLRRAITRARNLGLGDNPFIKKVGRIAFSE